nr:glycosyltransferase family A protein [uncultured Carboxylicivirga sp.]
MNTPLVSILITAYNREPYIAVAIQSAINQTYDNLEIVILDDCSTDNSFKIASDFAKKDNRIKVHKNPQNLGQFPTRNKIAQIATGKYIKYLDSDDLLYPHCIQVMVWAMEQFPNAGIGLCKNYRPDYIFPVQLSPQEAYTENFSNDPSFFVHAPNSTIINRDKFLELGGMKEDWGISADHWFIFQMVARYQTVLMPHGLVYYRIGHEQVSNEYTTDFHLIEQRHYIIRLLEDKNCPLSQARINQIKKKIKGNYIRYTFYQFLKFRIKATLNLINKVPLSDLQYILSR